MMQLISVDAHGEIDSVPTLGLTQSTVKEDSDSDNGGGQEKYSQVFKEAGKKAHCWPGQQCAFEWNTNLEECEKQCDSDDMCRFIVFYSDNKCHHYAACTGTRNHKHDTNSQIFEKAAAQVQNHSPEEIRKNQRWAAKRRWEHAAAAGLIQSAVEEDSDSDNGDGQEKYSQVFKEAGRRAYCLGQPIHNEWK